MNGPNDVSDLEVSDLVDALRDDMPTDHDRDLMRKRLLSAGILVAGAAGAGGTAGATGAAHALAHGVTNHSAIQVAVAKTGLLGKLMALPVAAKLTIATVTIGGGLIVSDLTPTHEPAPNSVAESSAPPASPRRALRPAAAPPPLASPPLTPEALPSPENPAQKTAPIARATPLDKVSKRKAPHARSIRAARNATSLAAEAQLLENAVKALHRRDLSTARKLLQSHRALYPQGLLTQEREQSWAHLSNLQNQPTHLN